MGKPDPKRFFGLAIIGALALLVAMWLLLAGTIPAQAGEDPQETEAYCLSCHSNPDLSVTLPDGELLSLYISPEKLSGSVHSPAGIECEACHTQIKTFPHPKLEYTSKRELSRAYYESCRKCHALNYDKTMDSMHAQVAAAGNLDAPVCTDCHGSHYVHPPAEPRALISETCGRCHEDINTAYKTSVHGAALLGEDNPDVPVCTDCHGVHNIQDPRTAQFRVESPDLCASCHADSQKMSKYGLSADVYNIYELSWHGVDVSVYKANWPTIQHESAVCTDCHGIHDMRKTDDPQSSVNPQNLLATCQKCHPGAGPNWTGAWTGHNQISLERTPFLFYVQAFYTSFTPLILWMCAIYVILQIIRATVERVRSSLP
ncbi:MAG: cytochrome c3 family protein [Chloroflexota bacterium]